jgi:hypothetical protein
MARRATTWRRLAVATAALALSAAGRAQAQATTPDTLTYATPALRSVVERAVRQNHRVPPGLGGYTVTVESELSIGALRREGQESAFTLEQAASRLTWDRSGAFTQHVVGYRAQQAGLTVATLPLFEDAWVVPSLYGNRLALLFGADSSRGTRRRDRDAAGARDSASARTPLLAVHPLADDRERFYRYSGGDTAVTIVLADRAVPIVRVAVRPREDLTELAVLFTGELDLDVTRGHLVRLRGNFTRVGTPRRGLPNPLDPQLRGIANVELINREIDQQWWLPAEQRFELQATAVPLADNRAIFRILTRFGPFTIVPSAVDTAIGVTDADTLRAQRHALSLAPRDSLGRYRDWQEELGAQNAQVSARDFDDVAPDFLRADGPPLLQWQAERLGDLLRATRVEGPFTGLGATLKLRDAAPGLTLRATAGYAWEERTVRGRLITEYRRGPWMLGARVGRGLDVTNDFRQPLDSGPSLGGFFGTLDPYDYVDRRSATLQAVRRTGDKYGSEWRVDVGAVDDRGLPARWVTPLWSGDAPRLNRAVARGSYARSIVTYDWRPDVNGEFLRTGVGGRLLYERGDGQLRYQRLEGRLASRLNRGPWTLALRADAGLLLGDAPPPQQLFEMGALQGLPGYKYKEFAGTQALLARGSLMYRLPLLNAPVAITRRWWLPAPTPALTLAVQAGRAEVSDEAGRAAVAGLGSSCPPTTLALCLPVSRPTDGWRGSAGAGLRLFGGAVTLLMARPFDGGGWRLVYAFGGQL